MIGRTAGAPTGLRLGILALTTVLVFTAFVDSADARSRKKRFRGGGYSPPYAAIVVDMNAGSVLHAANADSTRHPASLTKIMTLYLLFEQIEAGKLKMDTELPVSAHAASMSPSKLGLRPGQTIEVEDAIKALVTKSANDVAVVVAEAIGGDEDDFAKLMTRKARAIGMSRTVYANASGLPDPGQITTARDQATLGRAIQERFPKLYRYFSTHTFYYRGRGMRNHNRLLGQVPGVDGIKTGFIRASGFNLVASMRRGDRHVVAVVMGGASGGSRDARMRQLLQGYIVEASARRTLPKFAEANAGEPQLQRPREPVREAYPGETMREPVREAADPRLPQRTAITEPAPRAEANPKIEPTPRTESPKIVAAAAIGSADPIKPILVRTLTVKRTPGHGTSVAAPGPAAQPHRQIAAAGDAGTTAALASEARPPSRGPIVRGEWVIQVGAFPAEAQAKDRLKEVQTVARGMLADAEPFTERVVKASATLYRARFAGFDRDDAEAACKQLKRNEIACLAVKN